MSALILESTCKVLVKATVSGALGDSHPRYLSGSRPYTQVVGSSPVFLTTFCKKDNAMIPVLKYAWLLAKHKWFVFVTGLKAVRTWRRTHGEPALVPVSIVSGDVTYTYELPDSYTDVGSRLRASMSDSSGTSEYTYDLLGRQKTYKPPVGLDPGFFVEYDYNSAGQNDLRSKKCTRCSSCCG